MTRYFFDLSEGSQERDTVGNEFPDERVAQREAIRYAGEVLRYEPRRLNDGHMQVVVRDTQSVQFSVEVFLRLDAAN